MESLKSIFVNIGDHVSIKSVFVLLALAFHWVFEARTEALLTVSALIVLDTITGLLKAHKAGKLSSGGFFRFATKCTVYFILMATAALVDKVMPIPFASVIMVTFLSATEAISVMENLGSIGFAVPTALIKRLMFIKNTAGDSKDDKKP